MGLTDTERDTLVALQKEKATVSRNASETLAAKGYWGEAIGRLYYAAFHAVQALFIKNGISCKRHAGMKQMLGERFVRCGIISAETGRVFSRLEYLREVADYDFKTSVSEKQYTDVKPHADKFIDEILNLVN